MRFRDASTKKNTLSFAPCSLPSVGGARRESNPKGNKRRKYHWGLFHWASIQEVKETRL